MANTFTPTVRWYLKVLAVLLIVCGAAFGLLSLVFKHLPAPYKTQSPPAEVMPWKN